MTDYDGNFAQILNKFPRIVSKKRQKTIHIVISDVAEVTKIKLKSNCFKKTWFLV